MKVSERISSMVNWAKAASDPDSAEKDFEFLAARAAYEAARDTEEAARPAQPFDPSKLKYGPKI
jgi:hypothetical protein